MHLNGGGLGAGTRTSIEAFLGEALQRSEQPPAVALLGVEGDPTVETMRAALENAGAARVDVLTGRAGDRVAVGDARGVAGDGSDVAAADGAASGAGAVGDEGSGAGGDSGAGTVGGAAEGAVEVSAGVAAGGSTIDRGPLLVADAIVIVGDEVDPLLRVLADTAVDLRRLVREGVPFLGTGAGAVVSGEVAILGGRRLDGVVVAPRGTERGRNEVAVEAGLGLVDLAIDAGGAADGSLGRTLAAVESGTVDRALAIDTDTTLIVADGSLGVVGRGSVWQLQLDGETGAVVVTSARGEA